MKPPHPTSRLAVINPAPLATRREAITFGIGALVPSGSDRLRRAQTGISRVAGATIEPLVPSQPGLIVGGPEGGPLTSWARMIGTAMARALPTDHTLQVSYVGGPDGVTACNQFEARTAPDGSTALLVSGAPALAWLTGDPRAQFDAGHWLPIATGLTSALLLEMPGTKGRGKPRRLVSFGASERVLAATLGLSLLGEDVVLATDSQQPVAALLAGRADFVFVHGPDAVSQAVAAQNAGARPVFGLGEIDASGATTRDTTFADVPTLSELLASRPSDTDRQNLITAWRAVSTAAQIEFALLLPWLTPSGTVAWWRKAISQLGGTEGAAPAGTAATGLPPRGPDDGIRVRLDPAASFGLAAVATNSGASLALRRWLAAHTP